MNTITNNTPPIAAGPKPNLSSRNNGPPASNAPVANVVIAIKIPTLSKIGLVMNTFNETLPCVGSCASPIIEAEYQTAGTARRVASDNTTKAAEPKYWNKTPPRTGPNRPPMAAIAISFPACSPNLLGHNCDADARHAVIIAAPDAPWTNLAPARIRNGCGSNSSVATRYISAEADNRTNEIRMILPQPILSVKRPVSGPNRNIGIAQIEINNVA